MATSTVAHVVVEVDESQLDDPVERLCPDRPIVYVSSTSKDRDKYVDDLLAGRAGHSALRGALVRPLPDLYEHYPRTTRADRNRQRTKLAEKLVRRAYRPWGYNLRRVYVADLDPLPGDPRPRVYVGQTGKPIRERWREHTSGARHDSGRPKFSRVAHRHGRDLRPGLYERYPPVVTVDTANELERQVAHLLLAQGYRVEGDGTTNAPVGSNFVDASLETLLGARQA